MEALRKGFGVVHERIHSTPERDLNITHQEDICRWMDLWQVFSDAKRHIIQKVRQEEQKKPRRWEHSLYCLADSQVQRPVWDTLTEAIKRRVRRSSPAWHKGIDCGSKRRVKGRG